MEISKRRLSGKSIEYGNEMIFNGSEYHQLAGQAKHIQGKVSVLLSLKSNKLSSQKIRKICEDIYLDVDKFLIVLEQIENNYGGKNNEGKKCVNKNE